MKQLIKLKWPKAGIHINCFKLTFLNLIYLPAIIIITFALPFYMLFSFETTHSIMEKNCHVFWRNRAWTSVLVQRWSNWCPFLIWYLMGSVCCSNAGTVHRLIEISLCISVQIGLAVHGCCWYTEGGKKATLTYKLYIIYYATTYCWVHGICTNYTIQVKLEVEEKLASMPFYQKWYGSVYLGNPTDNW